MNPPNSDPQDGKTTETNGGGNGAAEPRVVRVSRPRDGEEAAGSSSPS